MGDPWHEFDVAVCRWIVQHAPPAELPDAAVAAMVVGCDAPSLARLAGMDGATWSEFPSVVAEVFEQRGRVVPSFPEAIKMLADDLLREIAAGSLDVRAGTHELYLLGRDLWEHPAYDDLGVFVGLDDAFYLADEGIYGKPDEVMADALAAVHHLIARGGVRVS
jgi:hypothetical protein